MVKTLDVVDLPGTIARARKAITRQKGWPAVTPEDMASLIAAAEYAHELRNNVQPSLSDKEFTLELRKN